LKLLILEPVPAHGGGSEAVMLSLGRGLARRGHKVVLLHDQPGSMTSDYSEFAVDIDTRRLHGFSLRAPASTLRGISTLIASVRKCGAQAVLSSHLGYLRQAALVRRATGVPSLFHLGLPCVGSSPMLRWSYRNLGVGVAPSLHNAATWIEGGWPAGRVGVVPNWVDAERFRPASDVAARRRALELEPEGRYVLLLGRICEQKGVTILLRAFAALGSGYEDVVLLLVGGVSPAYSAVLDAELERMPGTLRSRVVVRPVTPHPEYYYQVADVACVPSMGDEAFGLTVIEAMACGVPVLTSTLGMTPEILGPEHSTLLRRPGDITHWTAGLQAWLDDPDQCRRVGASLRERVVAHYGPEHGLDGYERMLSEITVRSPGGRA
jgi:glycosyltransferase involved in cell wall biosynthesis